MNRSNCAPENSARQVTTPKSQLDATVTDFHTQTDSRVSRRKMLSGALAAAAAATIGLTLPVWSQTVRMQTYVPPGIAPKPKGPLVFLDYDKEEINYSYDQTPWALNRDEVVKRNAQQSASALAHLGQPRRVAYGPTEIEKLDIYKSRQANAPIHVFIHGGAWRTGSSSEVAYMSETYVDAGAHFISLDFNNVIEAKGDMMVMVDQVRRAIAWTFKNAASFAGDANRLYVSGHSSGAHLAAVALTTDWQKDFGLPVDTIKGGFCASGMYELHPVTLSARADYVKFTPEMVEKLSPQRHLDKLVAPIVVTHGTLETPEFQRQNREFAAAVKAAGKPVTFIVLDGYNHFEGFVTMSNPYGVLGRAMLNLMRLGPKTA
jgi:arylformamidase